MKDMNDCLFYDLSCETRDCIECDLYEVVDMKKNERKEIQNMKLMVEGFGEIVKICEPTILELPFPEVEYQERYEKILDILTYVNENLKI